MGKYNAAAMHDRYMANREEMLAKEKARRASWTETQKEKERERSRARSKNRTQKRRDYENLRNRNLPEDKANAMKESNKRWYASRSEEQVACHNERERARLASRTEERKQRDLKRIRAYRKAKPELKRACDHKRRALKKGSGGVFTALEWKSVLEKYDYTCLRCRRREPEIRLTIDHVIPISKHGRNVIENIQPLCVSCNSSKFNKIVDYRVAS